MMVTYEDGTKLYSHKQKTKGKENCLALEKKLSRLYEIAWD